ncbi:hypothetical protein D3C71_351210 [compost metagenome]
MSKINLPPLPTITVGDRELKLVWFRPQEVIAYAEQAVREALVAQASAHVADKPYSDVASPDEPADHAYLRKMWRRAGGSFHGPRTETGTMPEKDLLPFLRSLCKPAASSDERAAFEAWNSKHGQYRRNDAYERDDNGRYLEWPVENGWRVWQARAVLFAPLQEPPC